MTPRGVRVLAWGTLAVSGVLGVATIVFIALAWSVPVLPSEFGFKGYAIVFALVTGAVGAVIASRRPSNPIGWILCGLSAVSAVVSLANEYSRWALIHEGGRAPGGIYGAWLQEWLWMPMVLGLAVVAWIFPDGTFLSRRWRAAMLVSLGLSFVPIVLNALLPRLTIFAGYDNPVGIDDPSLPTAANVSIVLVLPTIVGGAAAATARFRRGGREVRQQIKWLLLSVSLMGLLLLYYVVVLSVGADPDTAGGDTFAKWSQYLAIASFLAVPVSIGLGVLKYRLYDIDIVINKTLVFGALAAFFTLVYVAVVVGIGTLIGSRSSTVLTMAAAVLIAVAFNPVRERARHLANRLVYGERATPYEVLAEFSERVAAAYASEDVLARMAAILGEGTGARKAQVWLRVGPELRPAAAWPDGDAPDERPRRLVEDDLPDFGDPVTAVPVRHQGELLGALSITKPPAEPVTPTEAKLVADLAGQAGLVLRNVRLLEDLRASRQRLVAAQDQERRRIERNIHDGAQQQLVALAVKIRLAEQSVPRDPERAVALLSELGTQAQETLDDVRDLARGIYPPLLADQGLVAALEAQARKSPVPVAVSADGVGRYPQEVEGAVYFCVLEALQNVAKYANAPGANVRLAAAKGALAFEVTDDGRGFEPAAASGSGLTNIRDRLEALGGSLEVRSTAGSGTTVIGHVPLGQRR
jgi:signal transduction histidine kinase